eukprot:3531987-Lingulodinium_polyedra.AAC.1
MEKAYRALPEEFYTLSGLKVVGPSNVAAWCQAIKACGAPDMQEYMSGSGRLSMQCLTKGLK